MTHELDRHLDHADHQYDSWDMEYEDFYIRQYHYRQLVRGSLALASRLGILDSCPDCKGTGYIRFGTIFMCQVCKGIGNSKALPVLVCGTAE